MSDDTARPGQGIVTEIGWVKDDYGKEVFQAVVVFPSGPPDFPLSVVWQAKPVKIVLIEQEESVEG